MAPGMRGILRGATPYAERARPAVLDFGAFRVMGRKAGRGDY